MQNLDKCFTEMENGDILYTPVDKDQAVFDFNQLKGRIDFLRNKKTTLLSYIDGLSKNDNILKRKYTTDLIIFDLELKVCVAKYKAIKLWFDNKNIPYPGTFDDLMLKQRQKERFKAYKKNLLKKIRAKSKGSSASKKPKSKRPVKHRKRTLIRNKKVRSKYNKLTENDTSNSKEAIKILAKEFDRAYDTIKDIIFKK